MYVSATLDPSIERYLFDGDDPDYLAFCETQEREYELEQLHGGRTRCPVCDRFAVEHWTVEAHRDPTDIGKCTHCGHVQM